MNKKLQEAKKDKVPNPGSEEAIEQGCTCPVLDNAHGKGIGNGLYWYAGNCPVHRTKDIKPERNK